VDGFDDVEIPGGLTLLVQEAPQVPYYAYTIDYPVGFEINDVVLDERSGLVTSSGLNLPLTTLGPNGNDATSTVAAVAQGDWFPEKAYTWHTVGNTDGSVTLVIDIYPFLYSSTTTAVNFYKTYRFNVDYVLSEVSIQDVTTDKGTYEREEEVAIDLDILGSATGQDVYVSAFVTPYGSDEVIQGLLLEKLADLQGHASFSPRWDSTGAAPGYYAAHVVLKDAVGNLLDKQTAVLRLGVAVGEIAGFSATPAYFDVGNTINASLVFENTGSLDLAGTAFIKIQDETGSLVGEFKQPFNGLGPGERVTVDAAWDTTGVAGGDYALVGYALYDGTATEAVVTRVSTERRVYLPLVMRGHP
jgi:hypothetical protein